MKERPPPAPVDWQAAVDAAMRILVLASARRFGLIHTPSQANEQQAKRILELGRQHKFVPTPNDPNRFLIDQIRKERKRLCRLLMIGLERPDTFGNESDDQIDTGALPVEERLMMSRASDVTSPVLKS